MVKRNLRKFNDASLPYNTSCTERERKESELLVWLFYLHPSVQAASSRFCSCSRDFDTEGQVGRHVGNKITDNTDQEPFGSQSFWAWWVAGQTTSPDKLLVSVSHLHHCVKIDLWPSKEGWLLNWIFVEYTPLIFEKDPQKPNANLLISALANQQRTDLHGNVFCFSCLQLGVWISDSFCFSEPAAAATWQWMAIFLIDMAVSVRGWEFRVFCSLNCRSCRHCFCNEF